LGTYNITYSVRDAFGFLGTKTRVVIVQDTKKPTIKTISGRDTIDHQIGTPFDVSMYLIVEDNYWGINTSELVRTGIVNVTQQGLYTLRYNVVDGSGNVADEYFLSVFVRDIVPPVIVLIGNPVVQVPVFGNFEDPWVTAQDNYYPNVTVSSNRATILNTNRVGEYVITYTAQDPAGNTSTVQRMVRVIDNEPPVISVLGSNPFRMDINDDFDTIDPGVKVTDNYWPEDSIDIMIDKSQLKPSVIGTYFVYYSATDKSGNVSNLRFRRVEVAFRVGLNEKVSQNNGSVSVYPNPSAGSIQIVSQAGIKQITVLDMSGKKIQTSTPHDLKTTLTISENGLFLLLIETEGGTFTQKVYIQQ
jgi:hypothetical protein